MKDIEDDLPKNQSFYIQLIVGGYYDIAKLCEELVMEEDPEKWEWIRTTRFEVGITIETPERDEE